MKMIRLRLLTIPGLAFLTISAMSQARYTITDEDASGAGFTEGRRPA